MGSEPSKAERLKRRRSRSKMLLRQSSFSSLASFSTSISIIDDLPEDAVPISELKTTLRRFSKMVLAGYGGASLFFFGVHPRGKPAVISSLPAAENTSFGQAKTREEAALADAIDASEAEAAGEAIEDLGGASTQPYSWWDILLGKHDQEILEESLHHQEHQTTKERLKSLKGQLKSTAVSILECSIRLKFSAHLMIR
jgi:sn1-specific diacylglycerol lipase